ncbi:unnamed protein product [Peniophora sp. CBMAI 1063]|nr:unnamed protein product [Peniophora sp. CBMAI 1063]
MASPVVLPPKPPSMATAVTPVPGSAQVPASQAATPPAFEFTRRKRWADLLINELSEGIIFALSSTGKVLFCSHSSFELLGWRDEELVDHNVSEIMHHADRDTFGSSLSDCCYSGGSLQTFARLSCKPDQLPGPPGLVPPAPPPPFVLLEFVGRPHFVPGEQTARCVFAVAKPTPNRNTAMLNTFLELKIENARLQARVQTLKSQGPLVGDGAGANVERALQSAVDSRDPTAFYTALGAVGSAHAPSYLHSGQSDDADGAPHKRRKVIEPHVCTTCGRTDSPEWRKGPRGPKTLCNACGLRWAKKVRKFEESGGEGVAEPLDDVVPP